MSLKLSYVYLCERKEVMFLPPFVCLFVCQLKYSKNFNRFGDIFVGMEHAQGITMDDSGDHGNFFTRCFLSRERRTTFAVTCRHLDRFPPNFPRTRVGGGSRHIVSHSRKVSIKGSNFLKTRLFACKRVPCLWQGYGSRETFCNAETLCIPSWTSR